MKAVKGCESRVNNNDGSGTTKKFIKRKINPFSPPTTIELNGVTIHFPFKPYQCQEAYMQTVLNALLKSENALLESPTGTGKTLCLLCATLAWQRQQTELLKNAAELKMTQQQQSSSSSFNNKDDQLSTSSSNRVPTIIYASRTHSQLTQVVRELRNTRYRPKHAVLGSREQMCINPKVKKNNQCTASDINHGCNKLGKERKCRFRNNLDGFNPPSNEGYGTQTSIGNGSDGKNEIQPVMDLEDLVNMGKEYKVCPFYYTRGQVEKAELILVPYNYLFDKDARETTLSDVPWDNSIVIFDEAHNLESFASESASFDLSNTDIAGCTNTISKTINIIQAQPEIGNLNLERLIRLKALFMQLEQYILNLGQLTAYDGSWMIDNFFKQGAGINHANHEILIDELRKVNEFMMDIRGSSSGGRGSPALEHFIQCIKRVFGHNMESRCIAKAAFYRVHVTPKPHNQNQEKMFGRTVSYWCFAPSLAMEELASLKVRSILVTSGTLAPLPSYSMELGLHFPHTIENPHIISNEQIYVRVIGKGVSGKILNSSYERRKDKDYYIELGNTLVGLARIIPDGMLIFFPSYSVMETCLEEWGAPISSSRQKYDKNNKNSFFNAQRKKASSANRFSFPYYPTTFAKNLSGHMTPWKRLLSTKSVVIEPKSSADLPEAMNEFTKFLSTPKSPGCILMGVCRGKISEGIDFANEQSRAVVITGLPFPPSHDAKVKMKREYLDSARIDSNKKASGCGGFGQKDLTSGTITAKLSGQDWYTQQAHRAVNQAIGRVIRNQSDYGAVLLLDSRFDHPRNQLGLSKWLQPHIQKDEGFGSAVRSLAEFYKKATSYTEKQAEEKKKAQASAILKYEDAENSDDDHPGKVVIVRSKDGTKQSPTTKEEASTYVAPTDVIARVDLNEVQRTKEPPKLAASTTSNNTRRTNDAVFASKKNQGNVSSSKQIAVKFMEKVTALLPPSKQSSIRKAIVGVKKSGDSQNAKSYLESVQTLVELVNEAESFESYMGDNSERMLLLFFGLLPKQNLKDVQIISFRLVFDASSLGQTCKENMSTKKKTAVRTVVAALLEKLWCRTSDVPLPTEVYLREARNILLMLCGIETLFPSLIENFLKLIPKDFHASTRALSDDIIAQYNIAKMKSLDRNRSKEFVDDAKFNNIKTKVVESSSTTHARSSISTVNSEANPSVSKRKLDDASASSKFAKEVNHTRNSLANPYARKKAALTESSLSSTQPSKVTDNKDFVSGFFESIESDVFTKPTVGDLARKIKTNVPSDLKCEICSNQCKEPWMAECGHTACKTCWLGWLRRSQSCMTCRQKTSKEDLACVVYRKKSESTSATISKLCADNDSDDELEII